jgi:hypothetical protein
MTNNKRTSCKSFLMAFFFFLVVLVLQFEMRSSLQVEPSLQPYGDDFKMITGGLKEPKTTIKRI